MTSRKEKHVSSFKNKRLQLSTGMVLATALVVTGCDQLWVSDITYIRLHGPGGKYQGSYDDTALAQWAERIKVWRQELRAIYVYFDNDDSGYAARDA